ncbi:MAG TPA: hypothetical protein VH540_22810 [Ktedonobacterales bacterium]
MSKGTSLRRIQVNDTVYAWQVSSLDAQHVLLEVALAQHKHWDRGLHVRVRFDDPWRNYGPLISGDPERIAQAFVLRPVTPGLVRQIILEARAQGWQPETAQRAWQGAWTRENMLQPVPDARAWPGNPWADETAR